MAEKSGKAWLPRVGIAILWLVTVLEALGMGLAGFTKFGSDAWPRMFAGWGYPAGFVYVIGAAEMGGAVGVLIPRFATYAAGILIVIMIGALATVIRHDDPLGTTAPIVHIAALLLIGYVRRDRRWRPGGEH